MLCPSGAPGAPVAEQSGYRREVQGGRGQADDRAGLDSVFERLSQDRAGLPRAVRQRQDERARRRCPHKLRDQSLRLLVAQMNVVENQHAALPRRPAPQHAPHLGARPGAEPSMGDRGVPRVQGIQHLSDDLAGLRRRARGVGSRHQGPCPGCPLGEQGEQGGLADPRLAGDLQDRSPPVGQILYDRGETPDLSVSADESSAVLMGRILGGQVSSPFPRMCTRARTPSVVDSDIRPSHCTTCDVREGRSRQPPRLGGVFALHWTRSRVVVRQRRKDPSRHTAGVP